MRNLIFSAMIALVLLSIIITLNYDVKKQNAAVAKNNPSKDIVDTQDYLKNSDVVSLKTNQYELRSKQYSNTKNAYSNIDAPLKTTDASKIIDDRILFKGIDFTGFTNFYAVNVIDGSLKIPTSIYPVFGENNHSTQIVKIGESDQGDVYFNASIEVLDSILNEGFSNLEGIVVFTLDQINIEMFTTDQVGETYNLQITLNDDVLTQAAFFRNQLPACVNEDTRRFEIEDEEYIFEADACEFGYKELNYENLVKIKDPDFYNCLNYSIDGTNGVTNPEIKKGWVNANDIISFDCLGFDITSAKELVYFKNLQKIVVSSDFPDMELFNYLPKLKYLKIKTLYPFDIYFDAENIKDLRNIEYFELNDTQLRSMSYLTNMDKLKTLILDNAKVDNYQFLNDIKSVQFFDISNNQLTEFPDIGFGNKVVTIVANNNDFENIEGFEAFKELKVLRARSNKITYFDNLNLDTQDYTLVEMFTNPTQCDQSKMNQYKFVKAKCI